MALAAAGLSLATLGPSHPLAILSFVLIAMQLIEFTIGARLSKTGAGVVFAVLIAPLFLATKAAINLLAAVGFRRLHWRRTDRHDRLARPANTPQSPIGWP